MGICDGSAGSGLSQSGLPLPGQILLGDRQALPKLSSQHEGHTWLMDHRRPQVSPGGLALLYPLSEPPLLPLQKLGI